MSLFDCRGHFLVLHAPLQYPCSTNGVKDIHHYIMFFLSYKHFINNIFKSIGKRNKLLGPVAILIASFIHCFATTVGNYSALLYTDREIHSSIHQVVVCIYVPLQPKSIHLFI